MKKESFLKGWLFVGILFVLSAFLSPAIKMRVKDAATNLLIAQQDQNILVTVRASKNITIQLYMFNVEGSLVKKYDINGSKKFLIKELKKGIYLYEFFNNDEHLKTGNIELK